MNFMKKKKEKTDVYWRCYPPFIDAYSCTDELGDDYRSTSSMGNAIEDLRQTMIINAHSWGTASIGEQVLKTGSPLEVFGKLVLSVGSLYYKGRTGNETNKKFVLAIDKNRDGDWWDKTEFFEYDYPSEWNVT